MVIKHIELDNFLSYKQIKVSLSSGINVFSGKNAAGKTNLAESIYFASLAKSSKSLKDKELINWEQKSGARVKVEVCKEGYEQTIEIHIDNLGKKRATIDDTPVTRLGELVGTLKVVYFSPDELKLIKDSPQDRRRFLDISLCQQKKLYFYNLQKYNKVLKQRNQLLRNHKDKDYLKPMIAVCDKVLIELGAYIIAERKAFIDTFKDIALAYNSALTNGAEVLEIAYQTEKVDPNNIKQGLEKLYKDTLERDIRLEHTSVGPHRDDLIILANGIDLKKFGSQGQQRCAVLAMKIAEIKMFELTSGEKPVLILDDVLSELDEQRQAALLQEIKSLQAIITTTAKQIGGIDKYTLYQIEDSNIVNKKRIGNAG